MNARNKIATLGNIMQLAYVPEDFEGAVKHWTERMGAGPFFSIEHVQVANPRYKGAPADIDFSMALGYWGDMQIELIRQHNDTPSIYTSWRKAGMEGLHHVCIVVDNMAHARAVCTEAGAEIVQEVELAGGPGSAIYIDVEGGGPGTMVELIEPNERVFALFDFIREAHRNWDGSEPLRKLG